MLEIYDLKENDYEKMEGEFFCKCINKRIKIIFDKKLSLAYINDAVEHFDCIYPKLLNDLCKYTANYCKETMNDYPDVEYKEGLYKLKNDLDILNYIGFDELTVQDYNNSIVLNISGGCEWAEEEGFQWIIQGNKIMYVGPWYDLEIWVSGLSTLAFNYASK